MQVQRIGTLRLFGNVETIAALGTVVKLKEPLTLNGKGDPQVFKKGTEGEIIGRCEVTGGFLLVALFGEKTTQMDVPTFRRLTGLAIPHPPPLPPRQDRPVVIFGSTPTRGRRVVH